MSQEQTKKEALFNEVKGSLFEYLVAKKLALGPERELEFHQSLDQNYLTVLSQQDRMVRQFYPDMLPFLNVVSAQTAEKIIEYLNERPSRARLMGKFINSSVAEELNEADLILSTSSGSLPVSLKLNKKNAFVNTKSGGIKSFFSHYFPQIDPRVQQEFNQLVDLEFGIMAHELHERHELEFEGNFSQWAKRGLSELPGELCPEDRDILKKYYARIAHRMHEILAQALIQDRLLFGKALAPLMGFGNPQILQVVCFHDFKNHHDGKINIHPFKEIEALLTEAFLAPFNQTSSVEVKVGHWTLQIRVKPMNKFTTTAIKINCSVKVDL